MSCKIDVVVDYAFVTSIGKLEFNVISIMKIRIWKASCFNPRIPNSVELHGKSIPILLDAGSVSSHMIAEALVLKQPTTGYNYDTFAKSS